MQNRLILHNAKRHIWKDSDQGRHLVQLFANSVSIRKCRTGWSHIIQTSQELQNKVWKDTVEKTWFTRSMFTGFTHVGSCLVPTRCSCSLILESRILNYHMPPSVCWRIGGFRRTGWVKYFANWSECRPTFHFHEEPTVQREIFHQHGLPNWPVSFTCTLS